jgi:phosphoglycolate phosphatase
MHQAVIFDFDGTIADSHRAISACANRVLEELGCESVEEHKVNDLIGLPLPAVLATLAPSLDEARRAEAVARYRAIYPEIARPLTHLFPGMGELLHELRDRDVRLAIATGKSTAGAHRAIVDLDLDPTLFAGVVGCDGVPRSKPHPDMVAFLLERLQIGPDDAVVVGDTTYDVEMAVLAGVAAGGVTWGSHREDALRRAGASWTVGTPAALRARLLDEG